MACSDGGTVRRTVRRIVRRTIRPKCPSEMFEKPTNIQPKHSSARQAKHGLQAVRTKVIADWLQQRPNLNNSSDSPADNPSSVQMEVLSGGQVLRTGPADRSGGLSAGQYLRLNRP